MILYEICEWICESIRCNKKTTFMGTNKNLYRTILTTNLQSKIGSIATNVLKGLLKVFSLSFYLLFA